MSTNSGFNGAGVVSFESRMDEETARLIERHGGRPISAPSMQEVPLSDHEDVFAFADALFADEVDVMIFNTGVGTRMLLETLETRFERSRIREALSALQVVARGPKPTRVLKENAIPITLNASEPNTWQEIIAVLDEHDAEVPVNGRRVAVQEYGRPNEKLNDALRERGARLLRVPIYRWALPDDREPLKNGIQALIDGDAQVALFTSRTQVDHVMRMAVQEENEDALRSGLDRAMVASVGPVCSSGLEEHGIPVDFEPDRPKLAILIRDAARTFARETTAPPS